MSATNSLPPAERDVLACVCRFGEVTVREVRQAMAGYRPMRHASVVTLLKRLGEKGLVVKRKGLVGKAHVYRATGAAEAVLGGIVEEVVERVFHGDPVPLVASLFETRPPTGEEVDQLQALLDELKAGQREKRGV